MLLAFLAQAHADEWALRRSPLDARLVGPMRSAAERDPTSDRAFGRLVDHYRRHSSLDALIRFYEQKQDRTASQRFLLFRLYWRAGRHAEAAQLVPDAAPPLKQLRWIARFTWETQSPKQALVWQQQLALEVTDAGEALDVARRLLAAGAAKDAATLLQRIKIEKAKKRPTLKLRAELYRELSRAEEANGDFVAAGLALEPIVQLYSGDHWRRREALNRLIVLHRKQGDLRAFLPRLARLFRRHGFAEEEALARLYDEIGELEPASLAYRRAISLRPYALDLRESLVALFDRSGRPEQAIIEQERLAKIAPGEPRYVLELGHRLWKADRKSESLARLATLSARFPRAIAVHERLADLYMNFGDAVRAQRETELLSRIAPRDETHWMTLGEQIFQNGKRARAIETWKRIVQVSPDKAHAQVTLAQVFAEHDLATEAHEAYRAALRLAPEDAAIWRTFGLWLERGTTAERERNRKESIEVWHRVLQLAKDETWRREARSHMVEQWDKARVLERNMTRLRKEFEAPSPNLESAAILAQAYRHRGLPNQAIAIYERLQALMPGNTDTLLALEAIYRQQGRIDEALATLQQLALQIPARANEFFTAMSDLLLSVYRDDEALTWARKSLETGRNPAQAWQRLAEIYERKEDLDQAGEAYHELLKLDSRCFDALFALSRLEVRRGAYDAAAQLYAQLLRDSQGQDETVFARAGQLALDLHEYRGTLEALAVELELLAANVPFSSALRRLMVDLYFRLASEPTDLARLVERGARPLLLALSESNDVIERQMALHVMAVAPTPLMAMPLLQLAESHPHNAKGQAAVDAAAERVWALVALARVAGPAERERLEHLLDDREGAVREAAAFVLARLADPQSSKALEKALGDRRPGVAAFACLGLGRIGSASARTKIEQGRQDATHAAVTRAACAWAASVAALDDASTQRLQRFLDDAATLPHRADMAWTGAVAIEQAMEGEIR